MVKALHVVTRCSDSKSFKSFLKKEVDKPSLWLNVNVCGVESQGGERLQVTLKTSTLANTKSITTCKAVCSKHEMLFPILPTFDVFDLSLVAQTAEQEKGCSLRPYR